MTARLASGPVCWGVDFIDTPGNPPWHEVLDGIAAAGYAGTELGPLGFLPQQRRELADRGLRLAGGFVFEAFHDPSCVTSALAVAKRSAESIVELGGEYLLIIDAVSDERALTAGSCEHAPRLSASCRDAMGEAISAVADTASSAGVRPLLHPHAGTYVEFRDELEPLRAICGLCIDTGHFAYAGLDPVAFLVDDPAAVGCIHLKDLDVTRVAGDFWSSVAAGAFVPLGQGIVDLEGLLTSAGYFGYDGWLVVEQDRTPGAGEPVADLIESRCRVEALA
jgi:inosose dehydratase